MHSQFYPEQQFSLVYKIRNQRRHLKHFGKVGRIASEDVITELLNAQCLPALYYGLEACPVNKSQMRSLESLTIALERSSLQNHSILQLTVYCILAVQFRTHFVGEIVNVS